MLWFSLPNRDGIILLHCSLSIITLPIGHRTENLVPLQPQIKLFSFRPPTHGSNSKASCRKWAQCAYKAQYRSSQNTSAWAPHPHLGIKPPLTPIILPRTLFPLVELLKSYLSQPTVQDLRSNYSNRPNDASRNWYSRPKIVDVTCTSSRIRLNQ